MSEILFGKPLPRPVSLEDRGLYRAPEFARKLSPRTIIELEALDRSRADTMRKLLCGELDRMMGWVCGDVCACENYGSTDCLDCIDGEPVADDGLVDPDCVICFGEGFVGETTSGPVKCSRCDSTGYEPPVSDSGPLQDKSE